MSPLMLLSRFLTVVSVLALCGCSASSDRDAETDVLLDSLDVCLARYRQFEERTDSALRRQIGNLPALDTLSRIGLYERIGSGFLRVNVDSALFYFSQGGELADRAGLSDGALRMRLLRYQAYPLKGMLHQAIVEFERIDPRNVSPHSRALLFETGRRIYRSAGDMVIPDSLKQYYASKVSEMVDSLIASLPPGEIHHTFCTAWRDLNSDNEARGLAEFHAMLKNDSADSRVYAGAAEVLASYYLDRGRSSEALAYLVRSAIADVSDGMTETGAVGRLGQLLFEMGDHNRAYYYLTFSFEQAVESGARLKVIQTAESLPMVRRAILHQEQENRRLQTVLLVALGFLALTLLVIVFIFYRHRHRLERLRERLGRSVDLRDSSIRQLMSLLGDDLVTFDRFSAIVSRRIRDGKTGELLLSIESGEVMRGRLHEFNEVFDAAFLRVFPDFPEQVNRLFLPDRQLQIPSARALTPELRLLAFMRLGIDDSEHIARFMGLSVNSVYTYRNALRRRAADRENFEKNVENIGKIS